MEPIVKEIQAKHDIRHLLAVDRTIMANERTFLSYTNTSLALLVPGVSFIHFTDSLILSIMGGAFVPISLLTFYFGFRRYKNKKEVIREEKKMLEQMLNSEYCNVDLN